MPDAFSAVYNPDYAELFNPKPIGEMVNPCIHLYPAEPPLDFAKIQRALETPILEVSEFSIDLGGPLIRHGR